MNVLEVMEQHPPLRKLIIIGLKNQKDFPVVQWLRICLAMQGTQV